jgi:hypothetical protein
MFRLAGALVALILLGGLANAAQVDWPGRSGLPWHSGVTHAYDRFEAWRGRPLDVYVTWHPHRTWEEIREANEGAVGRRLLGKPGRLSMGIAMLPRTHRGQFAECARGDFDEHYRAVAERLVEWGRADAILRIGWEANGSGFPWNIQGDIENYIGCFRRIVEVMRAISPDFVIDWTMRKSTAGFGSRPVTDAWPGDDVVDIVGVNYYDGWPAYDTPRAWSRDLNALENGGPRGLQSWLDFARSKGKKLSVSEWGLRRRASSDNPLYIEMMLSFFRDNAADIAYEAYFNPQSEDGRAEYSIFPPDHNPLAAAKYLELMRTGG